jgi:hypothetical protein
MTHTSVIPDHIRLFEILSLSLPCHPVGLYQYAEAICMYGTPATVPALEVTYHFRLLRSILALCPVFRRLYCLPDWKEEQVAISAVYGLAS